MKLSSFVEFARQIVVVNDSMNGNHNASDRIIQRLYDLHNVIVDEQRMEYTVANKD